MSRILKGRLLAVLTLACALGGTVWAQPVKEEWKKLKVRDGKQVVEYFIIPNARLRALGLKVEDIPDDQNAAFVYWQAFEAIPELPEGKAFSDAFYNATKRPWGPEDGPEWKQLYEWFQSTSEARKLLRKAAGMPICRFPELLRQPRDNFLLLAVALPHLARMRQAARLCCTEANLLQKEGKPREALEAFLLLFPMARDASAGSSLIGTLVGIACIQMAVAPTFTTSLPGSRATYAVGIPGCLQRGNLDADTLKWLADKLEADAEDLPDRTAWISYAKAEARQAVRMEPGVFESGGDDEQGGQLAGTRAFRILWPDRTLAKDMDKAYDSVEALLRKAPWEAEIAQRTARLPPGLDACKDWNFFAGMLMPALESARTAQTTLLCRYDALRINVALRRYKLQNGEYPASLDKLVPTLLKELPPDPFSGKPFHYRLENGEWMFYSVGENLRDDGSVDGLGSYREGDIVFRSKPEEPK